MKVGRLLRCKFWFDIVESVHLSLSLLAQCLIAHSGNLNFPVLLQLRIL